MYEPLGDRKYILKGNIDELEIILNVDNSFNLDIEKLSKKINVGKIPVYYETEFSDQDKEAIQNLLK